MSVVRVRRPEILGRHFSAETAELLVAWSARAALPPSGRKAGTYADPKMALRFT